MVRNPGREIGTHIICIPPSVPVPEQGEKMKHLNLILLAALFLLIPPMGAQTTQLGEDVFSSDEGAINLAVQSGVAARRLDSDYLMFMLFMGADEGVSATITPQEIVMITNDTSIPMPSLKELRENYNGDARDLRTYNNLTQAPLYSSKLRFLVFTNSRDFFPSRREAHVPLKAATVNSDIGFSTRVYFKNPGLQKGDAIAIFVRDRDNPEIWGSVAVEF